MESRKKVSQYKNPILNDMDYLSNISAFQCLWESCKDHLDEVAITYRADINVEDKNKKVPVNVITYRKLIKNILKTYNSLKNLGVKEGDVISYSSITTPEFIYVMYASILIGAIFDPVDPRNTEEELLKHFENEPSKLYFAPEKMFGATRNIYKDLKVQNIITTSFMESLPVVVKIGSKVLDKKNGVKDFEVPNDKRFLNWNQFAKGGNYKNVAPSPFYKNKIISYAHTTGTTGNSKTLLHTNENWNAQWHSIQNTNLKIIRGETFLNVTVPWVDFGLVVGIHSNLCNGVRMDLDPTWTPETNCDYYLKYRPDWWLGAPGWIDPLFTDKKYENEDLRFGRYIMTGGGPLFAHKHELYMNILRSQGSKCIVMPGYGLSEITAPAFLNIDDEYGSLGRPFAGVKYKIVDKETNKKVNPLESGELWLRSVDENLTPIALGYLNNPEETAKTFVEDEGYRWVRTGDKVHENSDGAVVWESRYKNILTYNGYNIDMDKLASEISKVNGVSEVAIIGAITPDGNQRPIVCFSPTNEIEYSNIDFIKQDIIDMIKTKFKDYYEPLGIVVYDELPHQTMKINYQQLKDDNLNSVGEFVPSMELKRGLQG